MPSAAAILVPSIACCAGGGNRSGMYFSLSGTIHSPKHIMCADGRQCWFGATSPANPCSWDRRPKWRPRPKLAHLGGPRLCRLRLGQPANHGACKQIEIEIKSNSARHSSPPGIEPHFPRGGYDRMPVQDDESFSGCSCKKFQSPGQFHIFSAKRFGAEAAEISERLRPDENQRAGEHSFAASGNGPRDVLPRRCRTSCHRCLSIIALHFSRRRTPLTKNGLLLLLLLLF